MIIMREQLNVKQRQAISETPAKVGGGLVETCFSSLRRMVAFPGKRPWLGCCLQGSVLLECYLKRRISTDRRASIRIFRTLKLSLFTGSVKGAASTLTRRLPCIRIQSPSCEGCQRGHRALS